MGRIDVQVDFLGIVFVSLMSDDLNEAMLFMGVLPRSSFSNPLCCNFHLLA